MIRIAGNTPNGGPVSIANEIRLSANDREFVDRINNRITVFGQIPYTVPERLIVEVIKSAARYFYKFDSKTWARKIIYLLSADLKRYLDDVRQEGEAPLAEMSGKSVNIGIQLARNILVVRGVREMQQTRNNELTEAMDLTTYGGTAGAIGINNNLFIIERACVAQERKVVDSVFKSTIMFDYAPGTAFLTIFNKPEEGLSLMLDVEKAIDIENLYQDSYFERYVLALCKRELKRVLGGHVFELPGGVTMNADEICNNLDDAEKVEDILKAGGGIGDIIMKR
jgi:hypothetical protein